MCGRFEVLTPDEVAEVVAAVEQKRPARLAPAADTPRAQAFPGSQVTLLGRGAGSSMSLEIAQAIWGFPTSWSKRPVFNTRIESAMEAVRKQSGMWAQAALEGRCVIPVASFFEPHATETAPSPRTGKPVKRPYRFADAGGSPLLLGGVQAGGFCSIVTSEPNRWVAPVHPRMPLVLRFEEVDAWLGDDWPSLADRSGIALDVRPEFDDAPAGPEQLSLF